MTGRGWAYAGALLGGTVSVAANVAHSYVPPPGAPAGWVPQDGAIGGAVFWPVALFVAIEILARVAWPAGWRYALVRYAGLLPVAVVAAVVSYRHLSGLLDWYGEDALTVVIGPLAVDGLMVMATGALVATGGRAGRPEAGPADTTADIGRTRGRTPESADVTVSVDTSPDTARTRPSAAASAGADIGPDVRADIARTRGRTSGRTRAAGKPDTATAINRLRDRHPDMSSADIARRLGITDRTVRRHLANGTPVSGLLPASGQ